MAVAEGIMFVTVRVRLGAVPHKIVFMAMVLVMGVGVRMRQRLVPARTDGGVGVFLVDPGSSGVELERNEAINDEPTFTLRLRGAVGEALGDPNRGDEIVEVKIVVPQLRDERSKEVMRELAKLNPEDPRAELWAKAS